MTDLGPTDLYWVGMRVELISTSYLTPQPPTLFPKARPTAALFGVSQLSALRRRVWLEWVKVDASQLPWDPDGMPLQETGRKQKTDKETVCTTAATPALLLPALGWSSRSLRRHLQGALGAGGSPRARAWAKTRGGRYCADLEEKELTLSAGRSHGLRKEPELWNRRSLYSNPSPPLPGCSTLCKSLNLWVSASPSVEGRG